MSQVATGAAGSGVPDEAVLQLQAQVRGAVLRPGEAGYEQARRVFNGMVDRRPSLVVQPLDTTDVQATVRLARQYGLLVSIKAGGHSAPGHAVCDGALMIDLCRLKAIEVDPANRTATAEGGVTWGEFDAATQALGLAVTGGRIRSTGIAGLTLGSGSGWLERKLGFTVDNLLGAEVVLATGEVVHASQAENAELFWGLRGGGGNFGIVTRFQYRLHPVGPLLYAGLVAFPREMTPRVLKVYRDFLESAPDEVGGAAALITAPPAPFVPSGLQGKPVVAVVVFYAGDPGEGEQAFRPILDLDPPLRMVQPMPYVAVQGLLEDANPHGLRNYWRADMYPELPDDALDALASAASAPLSAFTTVLMQPMGGQAGRVAEDATAMGWRGAKWSLHILGMWQDAAEDKRHIKWVRALSDAVAPWAQRGTYLNYLMDEGDRRVQESFGAHYDRMVALKDRYDATNFFRLNQNIKPTM